MNEVEVSVICLAYNHEKYLDKCLKAMVSQKTEFPYEIIINDDCSTDDSRNIIEQYKRDYPDKIVSILQSENQYSKGVDILNKYVYPLVRGKYIAFCEGDDLWIDDNKLQIQYNYMEANGDCFCLAHSYIRNNLSNNSSETVRISDKDRDFDLKEVLEGGGGMFATASLFVRKEVVCNIPRCFECSSFGDFQIPIYSAILGRVHYFDKTMCSYNYMATGSWSERTYDSLEKMFVVNKKVKELLENINLFYNKKYDYAFAPAISFYEIRCLLFKRQYKEIRKNAYYKENKNKFSKKERLMIFIGSISVRLLDFIFKVKRIFR